MSAIWYTSDTHFMHKYVSELRGFDSTEAHDEAIITNWNASVKRDDTVIHCGDFSLKRPDDYKHIIPRLNGTIHLIWGNHDYGSPTNRDGHKYTLAYSILFASAQSFMRKRFDGQNVMISHYPYSGDHGDDRYTQYRLRNEGLPIIHGHTHSEDVISHGAMTLQIHVGLDAWNLKPVHQEEVMKLIKDNA